MAIDFTNPLVAGVTLIREAIQSQNFSTGVDGWRIAADGTAEFSDLTIRSSDGSGSTVTIANGQILVRDGSNNLVIEIDATGYGLYNSDGVLVAAIALDSGSGDLGGFYARGFQSQTGTDDDTFAFLSGGRLFMGPIIEALADDESTLTYQCNSTAGYVAQTLATGSLDLATTDECRLQLISQTGFRPKAWVDGGNASTPADLEVTGSITTGNMRWGGTQTPAPGVTPGTTSATVVFAEPMPSVPRVLVTIRSGADPTGTTIRAYTDAESETGFTVYVGRETGVATNIDYLAICD